ncbi:MAG TPA: DotU family type VI secretion system protein [Burkholderiaceae bacterium]|nr:DotU family type VI secretion system protein [Burkholderiaceae bacterium]
MEPPGRNDPFASFDEQRTFIKPRPFDPATHLGAQPAAQPRAPYQATDASAPALGLNPLVTLADALLLLVPQLRGTRQVGDPEVLRNALAQGVREFSGRATAAGIAPERVMAARYVLCTMIDEAAADTPWGGSGVWARRSLLSMFHNEAWGGEKVFQLMARLADRPDANRDLLELIYGALALGFEGRYRVIDNGRAQLEAVRDRLAQILRQQRGDYPDTLAQHWQVDTARRRQDAGWLPLAVTAAVTAVALTGAFMAFSLSLANRSDDVFGQIQSLRLSPPVVTPPPAPATPPAPPPPRLAQFLQPEINAGVIGVRDEADRSIVTLRGDGLFAPGSETIVPAHQPVVTRIAEALAQMAGNVIITGHSDSTPIRTARFPSNWHLSEARAETVRALLASHKVAPERLRAEGRADAEPLVPNDSPGNRSLNRRVEITLVTGRGHEAGASGVTR